MVIPALREGGCSVSVLCGFPLCALPGDFLCCCSVMGFTFDDETIAFPAYIFFKDSKIPRTQVVSEVYLLGWRQQLNLPLQIIWVNEALSRGKICSERRLPNFWMLLWKRNSNFCVTVKSKQPKQSRRRQPVARGNARECCSAAGAMCWPEATRPRPASELAQGKQCRIQGSLL